MKTNHAELAERAARAGGLDQARDHLEKAIAAEPRNPVHRLNLAMVLERLGEPARMAERLSEVLRLKPDANDAARWLSALSTRFRLADAAILDPIGLRAALAFSNVDRQALAKTAFDQLTDHGSLNAPLADALANGFRAAGQALVLKRTGTALKDDLLLASLAAAPIMNPAIEQLLTGVRRALLLDVLPQRFAEDKALNAFAVALAEQLNLNEHLWFADLDELQAIGTLKATAGAPNRDLLLALYVPAAELIKLVPLSGLKPKALAAVLGEIAAETARWQTLEPSVKSVAPARDKTSVAVAGHYAKAPYPRYQALHEPTAGVGRQALARFAGADNLGFMDAPFDVLIAGCGTGRQAIMAAHAYGPNARITAIDISRPSLAYATRMAERLNLGHITFIEADILAVEKLGGIFDIIESIGVLHHMADPAAGLAKLTGILKPKGLMYLGLYAHSARELVHTIQTDKGFPGVGCTDDALRAFRYHLLTLPADDRLSDIRVSHDFYTTPEVRDLLFHPNEEAFALPEIETHLAAQKLQFLGFTLGGEGPKLFKAAYPKSAWPGTLAEWVSLETSNPGLFEAMYRFWVRKE